MGEAMRGPMQGERLEIVPAIVTDWASWKRHHPETTVAIMSRSASWYNRDFHTEDSGLLIALLLSGKSRGWHMADMIRNTMINDEMENRSVLVAYERGSGTALIYDRTVSGNVLTFERRDGRMADLETGSEWDVFTGRALQGQYKGQQLQLLPGILSEFASWNIYHPDCSYWRPDEETVVDTEASGPELSLPEASVPEAAEGILPGSRKIQRTEK